MTDDLPRAAKFWSQCGIDHYLERIALMRDGNNIPPDAPTPIEIVRIATVEAQENQ